MTHPSDQTSPSTTSTGETDRQSLEREQFETVDLESLDSGRSLVWVQPLLTATVLTVLVGSAIHAVRKEADAITVAAREIAILDWLYALSLLALAIMVVPTLVTQRGRVRDVLGRVRERPLVAVCGGYLVALLGAGTLYPLFASEPLLDPLISLQPPFWTEISDVYVPTCHGPMVDGQCHGTLDHPLGTNGDGEDLLKIGLFGLNTSLRVAVTASVLAIVLGIVVGTTAGYVGGLTDELLMRYVDVQRSLPSFFAYVLLIFVVGVSYPLMILVFGLLSWGNIARQVRSEVVQRRAEPFVKAAELSGASSHTVVFRHILPNASNAVVTAATVLFGKFVIYEASLSFLSLTETNFTSLGNEIAGAIGRVSGDVATPASGPAFDWGMVPWVVLVPVGILCSLLLAVGVLSDGLRDIADPRK
jgi:peptide/nickel transport system permease protein